MSTIPEIVRQRVDSSAEDPQSLQHPNFDIASLSYHLPSTSSRDAYGFWSLGGNEFEFRLYGQISAQQTFLGPYGDMLYHKTKSRYSGPWSVPDALRAKKKLSLALPDSDDISAHGRTLARQYEHLRNLQQLNFNEAAVDFPGQARYKSGFVIRVPDRWRVSILSDNIFYLNLPHGHDAVTLGPQHDPQGILARLTSPGGDGLLVKELEAVDSMGKTVAAESISGVFRPGSWVEVYCKLRVWISKDGPVQTRSYHVIFDAMQFLCEGSLKENIVDSGHATVEKRKREFAPVVLSLQKRPRVE
ncbi:hypothetical protein AURDEDRAFT_176519 [Auricularia subglabra TFB-10046 SS5]|uniref:Uncharacterized protein n=1 Tax=Auricularia subglabra (strain TFB-10046 / SS5) TaxID=717982 RepID=J0WR70_AURST|nr:hypothetical protein AURDEDRAFT_176519 [Auricularia subglabra TFB-10046 SS5]